MKRVSTKIWNASLSFPPQNYRFWKENKDLCINSTDSIKRASTKILKCITFVSVTIRTFLGQSYHFIPFPLFKELSVLEGEQGRIHQRAGTQEETRGTEETGGRTAGQGTQGTRLGIRKTRMVGFYLFA